MQPQPVTVRVDDGSFILSTSGEISPETLDFSTGLIATMSIGAMVCTGIHTGHVRVDALVGDRSPEEADLAAWDDVCEASVHAPHGELVVESLYNGPVGGLPCLSTAGPGWYRVRVHARGRDTAPDSVRDEPVEDYLLVSWPAPPETPLILRATDRDGRGRRMNCVRPLDPPPPVRREELPSEKQAEHDNLSKRRSRRT